LREDEEHPEPGRQDEDQSERTSEAAFRGLASLEARPLRVRVAEVLREAILRGELKPGETLTELTLARQLKVSRAPIREAMRILAEEGLIETVPYKGTTVRRLTARDVEETYSLREQLEAFAIRRIIESPDPIDTSLLERLCASMEDAAARGDLARLNSEDERFHRTMIQLGRHELLMTMWHVVAMRVRQIISLRNERNHDLIQVARNHPPIVAAITRRDLEEALALLKPHILSAADLTDPVDGHQPW